MDRKDIEETVVAALRQSGLNPHRAAVGAGLPEDAIRNVLAGHEPKASRLAQICAALGLEFYIGPPRAGVAESFSSASLRDLEAGARALLRIVIEAGGNPIPDDLWPVLAARRAKKAGEESLPDGLYMLSGDEAGWPNYTVVRVEGTSMMSTLEPGSSVVVDQRRKEWSLGDVYAFRLSGALLVRRADVGKQGEHVLVGDHPRSKPVPFPDTEAIVGTVVGEYLKFRHHPTVPEDL